MNKKKVIIISVIVIILTAIITGTYLFLTNEDEKTSLNIIEKQWIENNKNNIIDLSVVNNVPIFNYEGEGVIFDFLKDLEEKTGLEFNEISYNNGEDVQSEYSIGLTNEVTENDILIYQDNYAIITNVSANYSSLDEIPQLIVGVLTSDLENVNYYLKKNSNIVFKTYDTDDKLINGLTNNEVNAIALPKTLYFKDINSANLKIAYNISDLNTNLVIHLGNNKKLNTILKKYFKVWNSNNYQKSFNEHFSNAYFTFNGLYDESIANFKSKQYKYGFVNYEPYDSIVNGKFVGINANLIKDFANISGIDVEYVEYKSVAELIKAFNENKVDLFFNNTANSKFDMDVVSTVSPYNENVVVLTNVDNDQTINSLASLKGLKVLSIKDTLISNTLKEWNIAVTEFNNINKLIKAVTETDVIVVDYPTYEIYRHNLLSEYRVVYQENLEGQYNFVIRDIKDNKIFSDYFNFYLSFNGSKYENSVNYLTFESKIKNTSAKYIALVIVIIIIGIATAVYMLRNKKPKKKKDNAISKESKIKYIDMLTSLKNRNYLNDSMEKWDDSEVYPQAVIIVDLNNVAYINDNYGHEEGDKVIKEAANILIKNQIEKTDIIRTNGNEFLIYLVEYDEKQVVSYMRKLNKEFKDLAHGFGAALGYSMINDALKTIDDAINEATLDMRNNKEEVNN